MRRGGRAGGGGAAAFGGAGRGGGGVGAQLATTIVAQADKNADQKLSMVEMTALANDWFDKMDTDKSGRIMQADFAARFAAAMPQPAGGAGGRGAGGGGRGAAAAGGARRRQLSVDR